MRKIFNCKIGGLPSQIIDQNHYISSPDFKIPNFIQIGIIDFITQSAMAKL